MVDLMTTFITRYDTSGPGVRLAVKDLIDMAGRADDGGLPRRGGAGRAGRGATPHAWPARGRPGRGSSGAPTCTSWRSG